MLNSDIDSSVKLYRDAIVQDSIVMEHSVIGDFSRIRNSNIGSYCKIDRQNLLLNVNMGKRSYTGPFDMIFHCKIGAYTSISYGVTIGPPDHNYKLLSSHPFISDRFYGLVDSSSIVDTEKFKRSTEIGNDVWIGCNATILRGVKIGNGAVIGANSLVNRDVPPYAIVVGSPAKIVKYRFSANVINKLLKIEWWNWDDNKIKDNLFLFTGELTESMIDNIE